MKEPELIMSPLCREISVEGHTLYIEIYRAQSRGWTLQVGDAQGNVTGWIEEFASDQEALDKVHCTILLEGIGSLVRPVPSYGD